MNQRMNKMLAVGLSVLSVGYLFTFVDPSTAFASTTALPLASNAMNGAGWSIDGSGNVTIDANQTVDLDAIVSAEWGSTYSPNDPPTFNNVTVNGELTTSSSFHDLDFVADGTVTVANGGSINMVGKSPGVSGANGSILGGGAGIDGNGGNGGGGGAGTTQPGQLYGGNGSSDGSPAGGIGGGHIDIQANNIQVNSGGSILDNGTPGQGGTGSNYNGSGGGGGGLIQLSAPTVNIASGSTVQSWGDGGGGGEGAPSQAINGASPLLLQTTMPQSSNAGQNGQNGSSATGGAGGNGGNANSATSTAYPEFSYNYASRSCGKNGYTEGATQVFSNGTNGDSTSYCNDSGVSETYGYLSDGRLLVNETVYNGTSYVNEFAVSAGAGNFTELPEINGAIPYTVALRNGTVYGIDSAETGLYVLNATTMAWTLVSALPTAPSGQDDWAQVIEGNHDQIIVEQESTTLTNNTYPIYNVYYWNWSSNSWSLGVDLNGTTSQYEFWINPSGTFSDAQWSLNTAYYDYDDAELGDYAFYRDMEGMSSPVWYPLSNSYYPIGYDPTTSTFVGDTSSGDTTTYYLYNFSNSKSTTINTSIPSSFYPSGWTDPAWYPSGFAVFDGNLYMYGEISGEQNGYGIDEYETFVTSQSGVVSGTYNWTQWTGSSTGLPLPNSIVISSDPITEVIYPSNLYDILTSIYKSPLTVSSIQLLAGPSGGTGATTPGSAGNVGTQNTSGANGMTVLASAYSGGGGAAGGNGGSNTTENGQDGGNAGNVSTVGQQGGSGGWGGGGGGEGEVEIETTNPSAVTGASNIDTPTVISVPNTLNSISLNQGSLYSQSATVTVNYSGSDMASTETLEIAQDPNFTNNVKQFSVNGTQETTGGSTYYEYNGQVQYTFVGVALNEPATLYAKLVDSNSTSNVLSSAITPILDTTPPSVTVTLDANQTSTTQLPLQVSVLANDPVAAQGMQMLFSPDGQTWYNVVTQPLSSSTTDANGNPISSELVSATANASPSNPVFVQAQSATDVQPYSTYRTGFSIPADPTVVTESGASTTGNIWTMDNSISPAEIESGEYYAYVLVQDSNKNQGTGASAIYYQDNADTPNNPTAGTPSTGSSGGSGSGSTTPPSGLVSTSSGTIDLSGDSVSISGSWGSIANGSTTDTVDGQSYTMDYNSNGVPDSPIGADGELIDYNGQPTIVTSKNTVNVDLPVSSSTTQYRVSTDNGQSMSDWQTVSNGTISEMINVPNQGYQAVGVELSNGEVTSNWNQFPVLVDNSTPDVTVTQAEGGGGVTAGSTDKLYVTAKGDLPKIPMYYEVSVNGGAFSSWELLPSNDTISVTIPNQGVNQVNVMVADLAGNSQEANLNVLGL